MRKDISCAFAEQLRSIEDLSECGREQSCEKFLEICLELRTHHEIGACIADTRCQLAYLLLERLDKLFIFHLLAFTLCDLLRKIVNNCFLFLHNSLDGLCHGQSSIYLNAMFPEVIFQVYLHLNSIITSNLLLSTHIKVQGKEQSREE